MFDHYYEVILADNAAGRAIHYRIRYLVYCLETGYEEQDRFPDGLEQDVWDDHAAHFVVRTRATGEWIAAMRIILPKHGQLPIQHLCRLDADSMPAATQSQIGELSRLCIVDHARRRLHDNEQLQGIASITPSPTARREPEIMLGLLRAAAAYSRKHGISYWYYMTTAALARAVKRLNILLKPVGPAVQHRGDRYPFLADMEESMHNISSTSTAHADMIAQQTAYRLYSEAFDCEMSLPEFPETISLPVRAQAGAK